MVLLNFRYCSVRPAPTFSIKSHNRLLIFYATSSSEHFYVFGLTFVLYLYVVIQLNKLTMPSTLNTVIRLLFVIGSPNIKLPIFDIWAKKSGNNKLLNKPIDIVYKISSVVCDKHFEQSCLDLRNSFIHYNSIPTLNLPGKDIIF